MLVAIIDQINTLKYSPTKNYSPKPPESTTLVPDNRRSPPLDGGNSKNIGGMWNLKHDISPPRFYELLIKKDFKGDTSLDLNKFYNHINMCINVVTILQEDLLPG